MESSMAHDVLCPEGRANRWQGLWIAALAATASGTACAIVYAIGSALGAFPSDVLVHGPAGEEPLTLGLTLSAATVSTSAAAAAYWLIDRLSSRPVRTFRIVALAVFLVSIPSPFSIEGASTTMIASLLAMHALVAIICVTLLPRLDSRR